MLIQSEFDIQFNIPSPTTMVAMLHFHPSLDELLRTPDPLHAEQMEGDTATPLATDEYTDSFGNRCTRFVAPLAYCD